MEVRARSGSYAHADHRVAALVGLGALLFILFSPWDFEPPVVALGLIAAYALGLVVSRFADPLRRLLTTPADRERRVRTNAAATYVERGVAKTERASGVLVYLSLLERRIEIIADRGVLDAVPPLDWNRLMEAARSKSGDTGAMLDVLKTMQPLLAKALPVTAGDRDELPNELRFMTE